jgi:tetratricopeptide (TPR) repeat protein
MAALSTWPDRRAGKHVRSRWGWVPLCGAALRVDTGKVKRSVAYVFRLLLIAAVVGCTTQFAVQRFFRSSIFKQWMYQRLVTGNEKQQLRAAGALAYVRAEEQLLAALKLDAPKTRDLAKKAIEFTWFSAAGEQAEQRLNDAMKEYHEERYQEALQILDKLTSKHPTFAEAWNQRAAVYWKLGRHEESILDCERALVLKPQHYGAWQGMGICRLHMGEVSEACRCLREALKVLPHDEPTQEALRKCEELLQKERHNGIEPTSQII